MTSTTMESPISHSPTTRLAEAALARAKSCACRAEERSVTVLRGFDSASRRRASAVRDRLRQEGVSARATAAPVTAARNQLHGVHLAEAEAPHVCAFVDATSGGRSEVDRIAGWLRSPLVVLSSADGEEARALLRLQFDEPDHEPQAFPSAAGKVVAVAFERVEIRPNQPETGTMRLRVDEERYEELPSGTRIEASLVAGRVEVLAFAPGAEPRSWSAVSLTVEPTSGVHTVHRDGLAVADLDSRLTVAADPSGLVRHHA